jgi:hypothetical protein
MSETTRTEWSRIVEELAERQSRMMPEMLERALRNALPSALDRLAEEFGLSNLVLGLLHLIAARSNDSYDDILRKALTLHSFALDARDKGNRLAILDPDDVIVHDIIGVGSPTEGCQTTSREG